MHICIFHCHLTYKYYKASRFQAVLFLLQPVKYAIKCPTLLLQYKKYDHTHFIAINIKVQQVGMEFNNWILFWVSTTYSAS